MRLRAGVLAVTTVAAAWGQMPIRGLPSADWAQQTGREERARSLTDGSRMRQYLKRMTSEPHHAGSPASKAVAEYTAGLLREWGYDTRIEVFEALLPYPTRRSLTMTQPIEYTAQLEEPAIAEDGDSGDANQLPTFNAYSASGDVTAQLVYVNYGLTDDYVYLKRAGVDVRGKVVIARYGRSWRGTKVKLAHEQGAVGCILYSDPRDDGYFQGDIYPIGPFRPDHGVQRGSVMDMPIHVGDPLSPGWASEAGSKRLSRDEAKTLMKIPVLPVSYADAAMLLKSLKGPVAPEYWRGALGFTYHVGPGPATVRLNVDFDWSTRPIHNVIATMRGSTFPDQWVVYGNHHDAWVNGANDPGSGASTLLETARVLAVLKKSGWSPKRSIRFALWDAEEFGLIGSTEWVEKHRKEIDRNAVVYINSDSTGKGSIAAGGSHSLETFVREVLRDVPAPQQEYSLLESLLGNGEQKKRFELSALGAGSDYVAFLEHVGVASLNLGFSGEGGGVYHSVYDTFDWYARFSDGDFKHGQSLVGVMTTAILRLSDSTLLPFEFGGLASTLKSYVEQIQKEAGVEPKLELRDLTQSIVGLAAAAKSYESEYRAALSRSTSDWSPERLAAINETIYRTERALTSEAGLPGRPWYKHVVYAPGLYTGYGAKTLPGVREAVEERRWADANREATAAGRAIGALTGELHRLTTQMKSLR